MVCVGVGALRYTVYLQAQDLVVGVEQGEQKATIAKPFSYFNRELFSALPVTGDNGTTYDEDILRLAPDVVVAYLDADAAEAEMGDVLFSLINAARLYHINPDNALERTNRKFIRRFNYLEATLRQRGQDFKDLTLAEMDQIWDEAKRQEETH